MKLMSFKSRTAWRPYTAKDYVQGGLVAMWDGIENAGFGLHDESATYWADLISGLRMSPLSDSYYRPGDMYGSYTTQCTQIIPKELWGGDHIKNITQSVLVDMDSVVSNTSFVNFYCYASPAAYRYSINTNSARRITGDHITTLSEADSAFYTSGIHRFDHVVSENSSGGTDERLYIDGVEIVYARKSTAFSATETTQARTFNFAGVKYYNMMQYSRPLTDEEIAKNYSVDKLRFGLEVGKKTAKDYVQNGLINQLDGIENAGYGAHDSTSYVDLITGDSFQSVGSTTVNADSYEFAGSNYIYGDGAEILAAITAQSATIELCLTPTGIRNNGGVFALSENATNRNFWIWSHNSTPAYAFFSGVRYGGSGYVGPVMEGLPTSGVLTVTFVETSAMIYWNGQLVFTTARNGTMNANYKRLIIGFIATGSYGMFRLHSMRLYNRVLNDAEIAANYTIDCARFKIGGAE